MQVWFVQVIQANLWEDLYVEATSWEGAVAAAKLATKLDVRWATYAC